ncbi:hypothetical protein LLEC1_03831 [Akanthomyces lecanii]|uniref:BTB domain-containing protein n=1 Tax=Cordyceps confragosa TaxID=2714763 RepID=A0A179IBC2_CORDF|nr:hypothetical protein LLEC1_03831 [Akanthomyces lecanii]
MSPPTDGSSSQASGSVLAQLMASEEYSDLRFSCRGQVLKVHKAVVCPQSSVIQAAVKSGFKESEDNVLNMDAFTPGSARRFVQFLYTKDYNAINIADEEAHPVINVNADQKTTTHGDANADESATTTNDATSTGTSTATVEHASKGKEIDRPELQDPVFRTILAHTRMNAMGDYYNVPELVKLANTRINATLSDACPDAPWVLGLPAIAEVALEIVNNEGLSELLTNAVAENIGTILAMGTLENSPLMTPFCLEVLKKCNATSQALSETLSYKIRTLNEVNTKYQKAADQALQQKTAMRTVSSVNRCRSVGCKARFECFFDESSGRLRCQICKAKH